jgi:hypothetical protein
MSMRYLRDWETLERPIPLKERSGWLWDSQLIDVAESGFWHVFADAAVLMTEVHGSKMEISSEVVFRAHKKGAKVCT